MDADTKVKLERIFHPQGLALVGASGTPGKFGWVFTEGLIRMGYEPLYPVNPGEREILGLKTYPSISAIPHRVDLAILLVPARAVPRAIEDCAAKGVAGAVIFSAGFGERGGEGQKLQEEIVRIARGGGTRLIGPNCLGLYCPASKVLSFPKVLMEKVVAPEGPVGAVSQSGSFLDNLTITGAARGLGFSKLVSSGNEGDLTAIDFLEFLGQDPDTGIIASYLEGVKDGPRFLRVASAVSKHKPILVWKAGTTERGSRAAASHTGSLAGARVIWDAAFRQAGIIVVHSQEELIDFLVAFYHLPPPRGRGVAIVSGPGGIAVATTDTCIDLGLEIADLSPETRRELASIVPPVGSSVDNPVDLGPAVLLSPDITANAARVLAHDPGVSMLLIIGSVRPGFRESMANLRKELNKPMVVALNSLPEHIPEEYNFLADQGVPVYADAARAARALAAQVQHYSRVQSWG
jgi:acyl-CoA synthetase (NDP forming)